MATPESRLVRLMAWIEDQFDGNVAAFCRYYALPKSMASFIYQLTGGNRSFGERAARKLEQDTGRPPGWLDLPTAVDAEEPIRYDRALCKMLPPAERALISDFINLVLARNDLRGPALDMKSGVPLRSADAQASATRNPRTAKHGRRLDIHEPAAKSRKRGSH